MLRILPDEDPPRKPAMGRANGKTDPSKRLAWMITSPPETPVKMMITPELAAEMLIYNTGNRPVSSGQVKHYAEQMKTGEWRDTFIMIQFSDNGRLIDGQHRLQAIVDSGCAVPAWVAFGAPDETFAFIDIGKKRTAADIFAINGVKNQNVIAAATKWIWFYENNRAAPNNGGGNSSASPTDPAPLFEYYRTLDTERLQKSANVAGWFSKNRMPNPSVAVGVHYVCSGKSKIMADEFFDKVATGVGLMSKSEPAYKLRDRLTDSTRPVLRGEQAAYTIFAWNALRLRRKIGALEWRGGPLPRVA